MYNEIYSIVNDTDLTGNLFLLFVGLSILITVLILFAKYKFYNIFGFIILLIPLSWCCAYGFNFYKFFLYRNLLLDNKYEVVSGKINNHTRQNWELDRIGKESFEIEGVYFNYKKQTPFFFPSYHATLSDEIITNDKLIRIKYITEDSTNYILSIEEMKYNNTQNQKSKSF